MPKRRSAPPPRPQPPVPPQFEDCCGSGCNPCIFDLYQQQLERYEAECKAWDEANKPHCRNARGTPPE